ncbi:MULTISPECIES: anaerobic ribonucleoside triphosphate reductase [Bacillota]|uniref:Anaerobic ribonucleoside triphosphate reductase n=2 Tax=Amedibacillus TaxID=2749846 RepID=A0A7G9GRK4_9FIRM|nr:MULTISPECIES: anaerobic ribonucleoside triphosphate reductase [Bacillota]QNM13436.1 anaerobic ribonucleoside triphosphate reductase [[Eubacterium] hominis]MCH4286965.1 anaerobic ribonucleoside triphosphate reductase [Amedibacillus hominis]RGB49340.1 anaerobic ribonucleoside triphosphate reductase [Absiella sp. AM22-9]RGB53901.1 anaerobic ribonucleoside triphosphate reductase [Absiella sp. AM10-20]RHU07206.1 anaerobic ribonucleoside triphosphate reductase [Absiella sp. AM27-20]
MITTIKKRDGREIHFSPEKITRAIFLAADSVANEEGVKADYATAEELTQQVVGFLNNTYQKDVPTVEEVQDAVVKVLIENGHARTSEAYILYRAERSRIRNMKTRLMKSIEEITFADSNDADIKRENANIDGNTAMGTMLQYGSAVSKEFCMSQLMNPMHARLHENGDIHIHDMDFMNMGTLTCCQIDLEKLFNGGFSTGHGHLREPQDIASYAALAAIAIQSDQNDQHGGQSIPAFDFYLAKGVAKTFRKEYRSNINRALELFVSLDNNADEAFAKVEEKTNTTAKLDMEPVFVEAIREMLRNEYHLDDEKVELVVNFTYKESLKATKKKTYQAMEGFVHNLNTMHSRAGAQVPFSSINFGTDTSSEGRMVSENLMLAQEAGLGHGETPIFPILIFKVKEGINYNPEDPNYDLFKLAMRVSAKRLFPNFSFMDAPFNLQYYKPGHPETETTYMGCRTRVMGNINGPEIATGRGNNSFTSINLPRLGIKHGIITNGEFNEAGFFNELDELMEIVIQQLIERLQIQAKKKVKNFPFLMGQGVWIGSENLGWEDTLEEMVKQGTLTIGFIGLAECLKALIGEHHGESERAQQLGLKIVRHMREVCDEATEKYHLNFSLIATPAEGLSGRFTRIDKKVYGIIPGVTDRDYYTNSFHIPVYYHITAFKKIQKEAPYHEFTNGGHISYVEVDGDPTNNLEAFEAIVRCMKDSGIGYGSINHPVDRDPCCGYSGVIEGHICPKCGRDETKGEYKFEKIRRITGYLVGTVNRFNDAKAAEERERVKHG